MSRKDLFFHLRILHLHRTMQTSRFVYRSNGKTNIRRLLQRTVEGAGFKKTLCETAQIVHGETGYAVVDLRAGNAAAVSYTHLDVYKRQVYGWV